VIYFKIGRYGLPTKYDILGGKMNEAIENILSRRSTRDFKGDMIPECDLELILEAGKSAPTGRGKQSPIIIAITNKQLRDKISKMNAEIMGADFDPFYGAPVIFIVLANRQIPTYIYDGTLVMENMMLCANALGIGSCWIHRAREEFDSDEGKQILKSLGIEGDYEGIGHLALGYANAKSGEPMPRKDDYVYYVK
jgi:nitroreductase